MRRMIEYVITIKLSQETVKDHYKPLMKPRDISVLELNRLQELKAIGRLNVFFSQEGNCSGDFEGKKELQWLGSMLHWLYIYISP